MSITLKFKKLNRKVVTQLMKTSHLMKSYTKTLLFLTKPFLVNILGQETADC